MQDDRRSNVGGDHQAATPRDDHDGERAIRLSAKSLGARRDAPDGSEDGSEDGAFQNGEEADGKEAG